MGKKSDTDVQQAMDNFNLAATMKKGQGFQLPVGNTTMRTIQNAERFCNILRKNKGNPGTVKITVRGSIATVKVE